MSQGYRKIFWGTILVSFLSPGGSISLVFVLIGWTILISGIGALAESSASGSFKRLEKIAVAAAAVSLFAGVLYELLLMRFPPIVYYPIVVMTVELILFHGIFAASYEYFSGIEDGGTARMAEEKDRNYMVLVGIALVVLSVFYTFNHSVTGVLGFFASLISKIYLLGGMHELKKACEEEKSIEEEQPTA